MRLVAILLLAGCLQVSASGYAQKVTLTLKNVPIKTVFIELHRQTGYSFLYSDEVLDKVGRVSVDLKNASIEAALEACFSGIETLEYEMEENTITIRKKAVAGMISPLKNDSIPGRVKISGSVFNETGQPLSGASVMIPETKKSVVTDAKGEFAIVGAPVNGTLIISYIGYASQRIKIKEQGHIGIRMKVTDDALDKVVIQGYGQTSQRLSTGDMAVVTAAEIEKQPVQLNPLLALQGRVAGLDIQQTSGYASAPIRATIRGMSSVDPTQVPDPLYVVDGVPLTVLNIGKTQSYGTGSFGFLQNVGLTGPANGQSPLFSINTSDIESITVLKDADATSIYGSRGANGVILITTKSGKPGKSHLDIHVEEGVNTVTRYWQLLNTPEYLAMRREALKNDGLTPDVSNAPDLLLWDTTRYTDWQRALYGRAGKVITTQASLTGGDVHTTFRIGTSYTHSTAITTASGADQKASVSLSITHHSSDQRFTLTFTNAYSYTRSDMIPMPGKIAYAPDAPSIYDSLGKINWKDWNAAKAFGSTSANPFGALLQPYTAKTSFLNSNLNISFQPFRGLTLSTSLGYNNGQNNQLSLRPISSQDPATNPTGLAQFGNNNNKNWIIEPQITYNVPFGPGSINILIGGSVQETTTDGIYIQGRGYTSDALLRTISNAPTQYTNDNYGEYRYAAVFGRIGYDIDHKYLLNFNARRDGSSNYGPGNEFGSFASIGAAWIFTEEGWLKRKFPFLSFGKLQGSYGTSGSDGGIPYGYITRWSSNGLTSYDGGQPVIPTQHANPSYQWEVDRKLEGSVSLGFFRDWVTIRASYFRNRTNNQLLSYPTPALSGFSSVLSNLPALVQNQGWEFTIGGRGVHTKYFSWAPSINLSFLQNKFLSFPGLGSSPYRDNGMIGHPLNGVYALHYTGVDPLTGQYTFEDKNHDGVITPNYIAPNGGDVYFKKLDPSIATGFGFNFDLQGLDLSLFFNVKKQTGINAISQGVNPGLIGNNQPVEVLARWQKPGDVTNVGKFSTIGAQDPNGNANSSDMGYTDASYIRLSSLSLTYTLPDAYVKKAGMQKFALYIRASNIFTITDYKGIDPETQNYGGLPPTRTIVGGLSINF